MIFSTTNHVGKRLEANKSLKDEDANWHSEAEELVSSLQEEYVTPSVGVTRGSAISSNFMTQ